MNQSTMLGTYPENIVWRIDMENKIIGKIQNLLELAYDTPDDEEGQTALLMAQKLMVKHNISMADVSVSQLKEIIGEKVATTQYRLVWWKERLAAILGANFRCQVVRRRRVDKGITQIIFFGYDSDAEFCTKVYEAALLYLDYHLDRLYKTAVTANYREYKKSYLLGFLDGLDQRFKDQCLTSDEFALVVQVPQEVLEEQARQLGEIRERAIKVPIEEIDFEGYSEGLEHAKETILMPDELLKANVGV